MVFTSSLFLFALFPIFFILYYLSPKKYKNFVIIISSLFFYAWGSRSFILIVIGTLIIDWLFSILIYKNKYVKLCLAIDIIMNIGLLMYFKYFNFFAENINSFFGLLGFNTIQYTKVLLPIGISFVIFQKITYCIDVSRGETLPEKNFFHLLEYLLLFPQIIAGPIIKYHEVAAQIKDRKNCWNSFIDGFDRFSIGLFKKVWIADNVATIADHVFSIGNSIPFDYAWIGAIAYFFQIFFDFSAYSDMAIGMLSMMGFKIGENFNHPYISTSITEFWKRWHISLTSWLREYLYFPLGGNRKGKVRTYVNQWIVFIISGFWHGASWNFIFWGAYHGTIICTEKAFLLNKAKKIPKIIKLIITLFVVLIGWIFFRAESIEDAFIYLYNMFNFSNYNIYIDPSNILLIDNRHIITFVIASFISLFPAFTNTYNKFMQFVVVKRNLVHLFCFFLFLIASLKVITANFSPFIYFRF